MPLALPGGMRRTTSIMLSLVLSGGLAAAPAFAASTVESQARGRAHADQGQKPKQKPNNKRKAVKRQDTQRPDQRERTIDRDGHVRAIRDFERRGLPPGLAKREELPPGLRKQLRERGSLPPGLEKRLVRVPDDWNSRLPRIGRYERRYFAGDDLLIVDTRTNRLVALMRDVLR